MIVLDRFEGEYAVIEVEGEMINICKSLLAEDVVEGDLLVEKDGMYYKDGEGTLQRKKYMEERFSKLWED